MGGSTWGKVGLASLLVVGTLWFHKVSIVFTAEMVWLPLK